MKPTHCRPNRRHVALAKQMLSSDISGSHPFYCKSGDHVTIALFLMRRIDPSSVDQYP